MTKDRPRPQIDKFKEAAREVETDDREEAFDKVIATVAKGKPPPGRPSSGSNT